MAKDLQKADFDLWVSCLATSFEQVEKALASDPVEINNLSRAFDEMSVDLENLESFRPTSSKAKPTYDFTEALRSIASAKRIVPRVKRQLQKAGTADACPHNEPAGGPPISRKIPEVQILPFTGDITQFTSFMQSFQMKYATLPITKSEKLQHLKTHVEGDPLKIIRNLDLTDENFDRAIAELTNKYDKPDEVISSLYHKIEQLPRAENNPASLRTTYYELEGILSALRSHGQEIDMIPPLRDRVLTKYPLRTIEVICRDEILPITRFQEAMSTHIQMRHSIHAAAIASGINVNSGNSSPSKSLTASLLTTNNSRSDRSTSSTPTKTPPKCAFCSDRHYSATCTAHPTLADRRSLVQERCYLCLSKEHRKQQCTKQITCRYCQRKNQHNASLCPQQFDQQTSTKTEKKTAATGENSSTASSQESKAKHESAQRSCNLALGERGTHITVLLTIINPTTHQSARLRAVLDSGSDGSYISESATRILNLQKTHSRKIEVSVFAEQKPSKLNVSSVPLRISNDRGFSLDIIADTTPFIPQSVHIFDVATFRNEYPDHADRDFANPAPNKKIDIMIGNDYLFDILTNTAKIHVRPGLHLIQSAFGWIIVGRAPRVNSTSAVLISTKAALSQLWSLETIGINDANVSQIQEEEQALTQFYRNITFHDDRYEVTLPWRIFPPPLPSNYGSALGQLQSQIKKHAAHLNEYARIIEQQLINGIIEEVTERNLQHEHYLPHHPILKPEKSTPIRIVHNASSRARKGCYSLNDLIYRGRNLLSEMIPMLIRFRFHPVVTIADIEKAYLQINIAHRDRDYVRFLWVHDLTKPPTPSNIRIFRFARVAFGITTSSFLLAATIRYHLQQNTNEFSDLIARDIYCDNIITGLPDSTTARRFYDSAVDLFKKCSMNLRSWSSNDETVIQHIPEFHRQHTDNISILGINWQPSSDQMNIKKIANIDKNDISLRNILKISAQLYDPLGWFSPITIRAKMLMQKLKKQGTTWDQTIPEELTVEWENIHTELRLTSLHNFPRRIQISQNEETSHQLHVFSDASMNAYACVTYLREETKDKIQTHLIIAKARVSPTTQLTIPKLELLGALIAARSLRYIRSSIPVRVDKCVLWTDSRCVLSWLLTKKLLPTFVQNRTTEICGNGDIEFRYVPTHNNPADIPSRGTSTEELKLSIWWNGPTWLSNAEASWPAPSLIRLLEINETPEDNELNNCNTQKTTVMLTESSHQNSLFGIDLSRYNNYTKLLRITAYVIRFLTQKTPQLVNRLQLHPGKTFLASARTNWLRAEQRNHYQDEFTAIQKKKTTKFNTFIDNGLLRCQSRLTHAPLSSLECFPILLPSPQASRLTELIILSTHENNFHAGTAHTLTAIRRSYWIPAGRRAVFNVIRKCPRCQRFSSRPYKQPEQSALPTFRLDQQTPPFTHIGIDVFGPLWVNKAKRWVLLGTCLVTRAIHLEELLDMTANELALAFRRITLPHSPPKTIISDNAPQYVSLKELLEQTYTHEWQWNNIVTAAPWMGGAYERLVGLTKQAILRTFHGVALSESQFRTALVEVAAILNSRPLTYISNERDDIPLTPNDLIQTKLADEEIEVEESEASTPAATRLQRLWKAHKNTLDRFWSYWRHSYLQFLRERIHKYNKFPRNTTTATPKIGDVVLIEESHTKRSNWKIGKILELPISADGQIRSATLRIASGHNLVRPLKALYPLETATPDLEDANSDDEAVSIELDIDF